MNQLRKIFSSIKSDITLRDVVAPKPSRSVNRAITDALDRASKRQAEIQKKAALLKSD